jgi:hypothetical protein
LIEIDLFIDEIVARIVRDNEQRTKKIGFFNESLVLVLHPTILLVKTFGEEKNFYKGQEGIDNKEGTFTFRLEKP